ncbi:MAG: SDR family oxidoreductase [Planctomycetes bacterium]|nr:SDR family oxidoreductase [Planctomycetota bacterium]
MDSLAKKILVAGGIGAAAFWAGREMLRRARWFEFAGKSVIVTGGSRGLGLVLARELLDAGARVAICARDENALRVAEQELLKRGEVIAIPCDVRDRDQAQKMVAVTIERFGAVDVLFNVAGIIEVGPLDAMTLEDFEDSMRTHFWGPLYMVQAVLPEMRRRGWGRIVNVSSIGGKRAVPHLVPYTASKFALVGLSHGLRAELARENILVTTICPTLLRTGSPWNAKFKGQHEKEYAWFTLGASAPWLSMSAEKAARQMMLACQRGESEMILSNLTNPLLHLLQLTPGLAREIMAIVNRFLPEMGGIGAQAAPGYASRSAWAPSWLTHLTDLAAARNNEIRPR